MEIVASTLQFKLDLYIQIDDQDEQTGALQKTWIYYDTVDCWAKGVVSNSTSARANDRQVIDNRYKNDQYIEIRTVKKINMRHKITNIRNSQDVAIWTELNYPTESPTVFEVVGVTPLTDMFGNIIAYNTTAKRSENQQIDI